MKKIFTLCVAVLMAVTTVKAQFEIGGIVGGLNGLSMKYWFNDNLALQGDLAVGLTAANGATYYKGTKLPGEGQLDLYDFTLNPNLLYHFNLPEHFKLYCGGGANIGLASAIENTNSDFILGKFGVNGVIGASYDLDSAPIVFALDFRPGYGLLFTQSDAAHISLFDWKLGFAVRYKF